MSLNSLSLDTRAMHSHWRALSLNVSQCVYSPKQSLSLISHELSCVLDIVPRHL